MAAFLFLSFHADQAAELADAALMAAALDHKVSLVLLPGQPLLDQHHLMLEESMAELYILGTSVPPLAGLTQDGLRILIDQSWMVLGG